MDKAKIKQTKVFNLSCPILLGIFMKSIHLAITLVVIIAVIIVVAALYLFYLIPSQTVQKGDVVSVFYTGSFTNGTVFNSNVGQQPFNFTAGTNETISGFDNAVLGMTLNQTKTVTIPANEAYGEINPNLIVSIPTNDFSNKTIKVGSVVTDNANGQQLQGVVLNVNATNAIVNFNSPLAGQTLVFQIKVVGIKS